MSCTNTNSPINIDTTNYKGLCDYKCELYFSYNSSSCLATNKGDYISIKYDNISSTQVTYNTNNFNVTEIRIYSPSLHKYNNIQYSGEFVIIHSSSTSTKQLLICIPIINSEIINLPSANINTIVETMSQSAPSKDNSTTVSLVSFNLNHFVPYKPFYTYTANTPYQPCSTIVDIIVFDNSSSQLYISNDNLTKLNKIIQQHQYIIQNNNEYFYNNKGPTNNSGDNIYIDCQPVDNSEDSIYVSTDSSYSATASKSIDMKDKIKYIILIGIIILPLPFFYYLFKKKKNKI